MAELLRTNDPFLHWKTLLRDPFELATDLGIWQPVQQLGRAFTPTFEVRESVDAFVIKADMPGIKIEDVEISLTGNRLTVTGHREQETLEEAETYHALERSHGSFSRTFILPESSDLEHINAELTDGVLTLVIPKQDRAKKRVISLKKLTEEIKGGVESLKEGVKESVQGLKEKVASKLRS